MNKKTISNTFTVNTIIDGESAPYYFQEWFAWSNDASTSSVTTAPTIAGSWATSIPAQGSYAYLWRKSIRYVWNESTRQYIGDAAQYVRMTGTNGTSIAVKGHVATKANLPTTHNDGDAYVVDADGHLYIWSDEANQWLDIGQFQGESGKTYYTHIAWATKVNYNSSGVVTSVEGFTPDKSPNDTTHLWMGVLVNESSDVDPSYATSYTWSYTKGVDGTSPYFADLNNEMDAIQCKHNGSVIADQTVSTVISMWKGSVVEPFAVDNIYRNGTQLTWDGNNSGVWPRVSGSTVSLEFTTSASIADIDDFKITIHSTNDTSVTRELHFTINGVRSNAIYRLVPSHSQIVKKKDGTYVPSGNVTCSVEKTENGSTSTPSSSEYTLEKSVNGGSYTTYSATAASSITSDLKFRLTVGGVVVDLETIPLVSDGNKGDDGVSYSIVFTKSAARVDENNIVTAELAGYAYKYVGGVRSALASTTIRYGYILTDSDTYADTTTNSSGFFDAGRWFNGDDITDLGKNSPSIFAAIVIDGTVVHAEMITISVKGSTGSRGKIGRFFYFGGVFDSSNTTQTFVVNDAQAPYFEHSETITTQSGTTTVKRYHVFNYDTNGTYTMAQMWAISSNWNNKPWETMTNDFKYIITEAIFGPYAHFGANIINKDYRLSQYGYMRGFYDSKVVVDNDSQYQYFDDSDPFGEKDMFSKDANMRANMSFSNYKVPDSSHYVIIGNNVEFAPSSSPNPYQIENTFTPSCYSYRFKTNDGWDSWYTFSSGRYYFALSESGVSAPTSGWSYSRWAQNLVPTDSKPYLWARLGTSGTPFLASSPQKNFTIEQGKYYAITFETANELYAGTFSIMIGTKNSNMFVPSSILKVEKVGNRRVYYGIFHNTYPTDFVNANVWTDISDMGFYSVAVYEAQFVPMLCEDLKTGKLVANNVVARGELHAGSLRYNTYNCESNNETIVVGDEPIVSIGTTGNGSTVKLPAPSSSKGRKVEVYSYASTWYARWDGSNSASKFSCPYGAGLDYRTVDNIGKKYALFYCDGSKWWILRVEN